MVKLDKKLSVNTANCRANNPRTCRYHGIALTKLEIQLKHAALAGDTNEWLNIKQKIVALMNKADEQLTVEKIFENVHAKPHAYEVNNRPDTLKEGDLFKVITYESDYGGQQTLRVSSQNELPVRCMGCSESLSKENYESLLTLDNGESYPCMKCGHKMDWSSSCPPYIVDVAYDQTALLSNRTNAIHERKWYHVTKRSNWGEQTQKANAYVHIGTAEAALARMSDNAQYATPGETYYMYEISIPKTTRLNPTLFGDGNEWPTTVGEEKRGYEEIKPNQVNRYVNVWEAPGSISLIMNANRIKVERVQEISW